MEVTETRKPELKKRVNSLMFILHNIDQNMELGDYDEDLQKTHLELVEAYTVDLLKSFNYDSILIQERERRSEALREANTTIRDLEDKLGEKVSDEDVVMAAHRISEEIHEWWKNLGFSSLNDHYISGNKSIKVNLNVDVYEKSTFMCGRDDPDELHRIKTLNKEHLEKMKEIYDINGTREVLDTDNNRKKIFGHITERYPNAVFSEYKTHSDEGKMYIDKISFCIPFHNIQLPRMR